MSAQERIDEARKLHSQGFELQEITNLLWLRQWYQSGGSDRAEVVRRLEFLKFLVGDGQIGGKLDGLAWNK